MEPKTSPFWVEKLRPSMAIHGFMAHHFWRFKYFSWGEVEFIRCFSFSGFCGIRVL